MNAVHERACMPDASIVVVASTWTIGNVKLTETIDQDLLCGHMLSQCLVLLFKARYLLPQHDDVRV